MSVWSCVHSAVNPSKKFYQHGLIDPHMYSKTCLVPCRRCKGTFVIGKILDRVDVGQWTSAVKCVCGFWLADVIVPRDSKCKILLQFCQKQLRATCTPSRSGVVVLAWVCGALALCSADGRTEKWVVQEPTAATVTDALTQLGAHVSGAQFKAPELQVGSLLHISVWLPKQRAGKLGRVECSSLGSAWVRVLNRKATEVQAKTKLWWQLCGQDHPCSC